MRWTVYKREQRCTRLVLSILLGTRSASTKNGKRLISRAVDVDLQLDQTHLRRRIQTCTQWVATPQRRRASVSHAQSHSIGAGSSAVAIGATASD